MLVGVASLPPSFPPSGTKAFTVETGKTACTFATQCICTRNISRNVLLST